MTNIETLGLGIDPTVAQSGGAQFEAILNKLVAAADRAASSVDKIGASGKMAAQMSAMEQAVAKIAAAESKYQAALKDRETATNAVTAAQERLAAAQRAVDAQTAGGGKVKAADWVAQKQAAEAYATALQKVAPSVAAAEVAHANLSKAQSAGVVAAQKYRAEHEKLDSTFLSFAQRMRGTQSLLFDFSTFMGPAGQRLIQFANGLGMAARATEQLHNSGKLAETGMAGLFTRVAPIAGVLLSLVAVVGAAAAAFKFFHEALSEGQELETTRANLTALTGSVKSAGEAYENMVGIARNTRFDIPELEKTYQGLFKFRREGENVNQTLKDLATLAAGPGGNLSALSGALEQVQRTGKVTMDTINLFGGRGGGGVDIVAALATTMHRSSQQILQDIKDQKIGTADVQKALHEAAAEGGYFASIMNSLSDTSAQAFKRLHTDWTEVKAQFGAPIDAALAPLLDELDKRMRDLIPVAEEWGEKVATAIRIITAALKDNKGPELFKLSFEVATDETIAFIKKGFTELFAWFESINTWENVGKGLKKIWDAIKNETVDQLKNNPAGDITTLFGSTPNTQTKSGAGSDWEVDEAAARALRLRTMIDGFLKEMSAEDQAKEKKLPGASPLVTAPGKAKNPFAGRTETQTDADIMRDYNDQLAQLKRHLDEGTVSQTEFNVRVREMQESTAKELGDPQKYAAALGAWNAYEDARLKKAAAVEARLKSGDISLTDAFVYGLQKQAQAYGSFASQVAQLAQDMTNSFANNLSSAIGAVITGTKDAKTAFKDFAVSVLNDISSMIIKMLVLKAIQTAIGFAGGGGSTGAYSMGASLHAAGGPISGGSGSRDDVPIMAMGGEYVIRKSIAQNVGIANLAALNEGRAMIVKRYGDGGAIEPPILPGNAGPGTVYNYHPSYYGPAAWNADAPRPVSPGGVMPLPSLGGQFTGQYDGTMVNNTITGDTMRGLPSHPRPIPTPAPTHGSPVVQTPTYRYQPGGYSNTPNYLGNFTGNLGLGGINFPSLTALGYGNYVYGGANFADNTAMVASTYTGPAPLSADVLSLPQATFSTGVIPPDRGNPAFNDPGAGMGPTAAPSVTPAAAIQNYAGNLPAGTNYGPGSSFSGFTTPGGMRVIGFDRRNGTPIYQDASGHKFVNPGTGQLAGAYSNFGGVVSGTRSTVGNAAFDSHAAGLMEMAFQAFGGNPNNTGATTDAGHTIFHPNAGTSRGVFDPESGGVVPGAAFGGGGRDSRWVLPSQSVSAALGLSFDPAKYNQWLVDHNAWAYGHAMGGMVGSGHGMIMPASAFMFARRMHEGGTVGLMPGEEPIIAKRGEKVVTPEQWANASPSQNTTNVFNITTTINSNGSAQTQTSGNGRGSEETARAVNRKIQAAIVEEIQPGGSIYNFVKA